MKRIDFEHGTITGNILGAALPMLVAQLLSLLYNIVDRIYIARIPDVGTTALGAVGLCFPIIVIITAFSNLFGSGGAPLFSISRGGGDTKKAADFDIGVMTVATNSNSPASPTEFFIKILLVKIKFSPSDRYDPTKGI